MPVNITDDELDLFNKNGFSDDDVRETINSYRSQGLDDKAIRAKIDSRLSGWSAPKESQQKVLQGGISEWFDTDKLNEKIKEGAKTSLEKRQEWEEKHPFISGIQKDYQPGYRAAVPEWELKAQYGIEAPIKEQIKTQAKQASLNLVPSINQAIDLATGGAGTITKQAVKQALAKPLKPYVGKRIAENTAQGLIKGAETSAIGGATQGATSSIADNGITKDLLTRPLQYAGAGLALGVPLGLVSGLAGGYVGRTIASKNLENLPTATRADKRVVKPAGKQYYQDYIQGTSVNRDDLGKITFTSDGLRETWRQQPKNMVNFPKLKENIKNATYIGEEPKEHYVEGIKKLHRLRNNGEDFLIAEMENGKKYYLSKNADKINSTQSTSAIAQDALSATDNIITDMAENINPEVKQSGLTQSVANAKGTPKEVKEILKNDFPEYQVMHNNELTNQAVQEVESNFNNELSRLTGAKDFDALDYEKSRQLAKRLFDAGRHEEAINLIDNVSENATKKGQAIQALSLWSNMTPEGAVYKAQKLIKEYNKKVPARKQVNLKPEQIEEIRRLQNEALNATDDLEKSQGLARTAKYVTELVPKNIGQKLKAYRNISLLLNPKTLGRNIIGNTLFNAVDTVSKAAAVPIDRAIGLVTGNKTRVAPQLGEFVKGGIKGAKTGFQEAIEGIDTRGLGKRFDLQEGRTFKNPVLRNLEAALDVGLRVPDRTQYEATFAESVANMMKAQGLKEPTQEILEQAEQEALESVFQNKSKISDLTTGLRKQLNRVGTKDFGLGDLAIPYAQTPANLVQQAINYSPLGVAKGVANLAQGNQRQASLDLARALIGTGLIGSSYGLSKTGAITPSQFDENYNTNKKIKANLKPLGISTGQIGNVWYEPFQPMSTSIAIGNAMASGEDPAQAGLNTMLDLPFLQNVNKAVADVRQKGSVEAGKNFVAGLPAQFVPTLLSQAGQVIDPYQREAYDSNILKQGLNQAIAKTPGLSKTLPEKIDVTGKPIERYESKGGKRLFDIFLNPTYVTQKKDDVTLSELKRLYDKTGETKQFLPVVDKNVSYKNLKGEDVKIKLTGKQFSEYQKQVGTINKQILDNLVNTDFYKNIDDEEKIKLISTVTSATKNVIDTKLFNKPDVAKRNLIKRLTETEGDKIVKDILKMYKNDILPGQINKIYQQNFE